MIFMGVIVCYALVDFRNLIKRKKCVALAARYSSIHYHYKGAGVVNGSRVYRVCHYVYYSLVCVTSNTNKLESATTQYNVVIDTQ